MSFKPPIQITHGGRTQTIKEWARETGISRDLLYARYREGVTGDALFKPAFVPSLIKLHRKEGNAWRNMLHHCYNEKHKAYPQYGGKGARVCQAWRDDFIAFFADVGERPKGHYCLGRYDKSKDFEPGNVAWLPRSVTHKGDRDYSQLIYKGRVVTLSELVELTGHIPSTLRARYNKGKRGEDLIRPVSEGFRSQRYYRLKFSHKGSLVTFRELAKQSGLQLGILYDRYKKGDREEQLVRPRYLRKSKK